MQRRKSENSFLCRREKIKKRESRVCLLWSGGLLFSRIHSEKYIGIFPSLTLVWQTEKKEKREKKIGAAPPPSWRLWHLYRKWKDTRWVGERGKPWFSVFFSSSDAPKTDDRLENRKKIQTIKSYFFSRTIICFRIHTWEFSVLCRESVQKVFYTSCFPGD